MDRLTRWGLAIAILAVVGATAAVVAPTAAGQTLVVSDAETGENLLEIPVEDGDEVTLAYTHSVEKTPIEDVYVIEETTLQMDRMVFRSHGAGLPSDEAIEQTDEATSSPRTNATRTSASSQGRSPGTNSSSATTDTI